MYLYLPRQNIHQDINKLYEAVKSANLQETQRLVLSLNWRSFKEDYSREEEDPLIHLAINTQSTPIMDNILTLHLDHHEYNKSGQCPLISLVLTRNYSFFLKYMNLCRCGCPDMFKSTALTYAVQLNETKMAEVIQ